MFEFDLRYNAIFSNQNVKYSIALYLIHFDIVLLFQSPFMNLVLLASAIYLEPLNWQ